MAYEPHEWQVGDKITSARLNNMERGIWVANNVMLSIQEADGEMTIDASYNDIMGALTAGQMIFLINGAAELNDIKIMPVLGCGYDSYLGKYIIDAFDFQSRSTSTPALQFAANSRTEQLVAITELPK